MLQDLEAPGPLNNSTMVLLLKVAPWGKRPSPRSTRGPKLTLPSGGQAQINPTAGRTFPENPFNLAEEMAIDTKSSKPLENKLPLKCSKVNFYFKGVCF